MAYKNLLVHLDATKTRKQRMETAIAIASEHNAYLVGLICTGAFELPAWAEVPYDMLEEQRKLDEERADEVGSEFGEAAKRAGINYELRHANVADYAVPDTVALHARYSDMVILGQIDPDGAREGSQVLVEHTVMAAGRPVLAIPYIGPVMRGGTISIGRNIMVAWDAGREATRAVNDAMPFLQKAEKVDVLAINPAKGQGKHGEQLGADIALHLARHGVQVQVRQLEAEDLEPGETVLSRLSDAESDLLVMGAYGHSRMRELVLGGATRTVLEHMTVPVMMSH